MVPTKIQFPVPAAIRANVPSGLFWVYALSEPDEIGFHEPGWFYKQPALVGGLGVAAGLVIGFVLGRLKR